MSNKLVLYYVIKILIILAQTSDMTPIMKDMRVKRLTDLSTELVFKND